MVPKGDSGGPLMGENLQTGQTEVIGIVSAGKVIHPNYYKQSNEYCTFVAVFRAGWIVKISAILLQYKTLTKSMRIKALKYFYSTWCV